MVDGLGTRTKDGQAGGTQFDTERINQEPSAQITPSVSIPAAADNSKSSPSRRRSE